MKRLIECASRSGARFEIYSRSSETTAVTVENSELKAVESAISSGVSLRLLKDGLSGFSFTRNLTDPSGFVENAMASLKAGVKADFSFPGTEKCPVLATFSERACHITSEDLLAESFRTRDRLAGGEGRQVNAGSSVAVSDCRLINSSGLDISWRESCVEQYGTIVSPSGSRYLAGDRKFDLSPLPTPLLEGVPRLFEFDRFKVRPSPGRRNVLFMPRAVDVLLWRVQSGMSGQSLLQKNTPCAGKIGEKMFSDLLTLRNNPLNDRIPGARSVDDEGVPCSDFVLVDKGVFKGFYYDLNQAAKAGTVSTGNGFRCSVWGVGDPVMLRPQPYLGHLYFDRGAETFDGLIKKMGNGLIVFGTLGMHTGNIANGDFSVGLSLGLCVENGRIVGKAKDTMVSGNIYDVMKRAVDIGCESDVYHGNNPPVLFEGVDVSS